MDGIEHDYMEVNGVRLHYAHDGDGPLMVFLHGFPQCWYMWRHQLPEFARDHLVVAPDLRGYNLSSKPDRLTEYGPWHAAEDVRALVDLLGFRKGVTKDVTVTEAAPASTEFTLQPRLSEEITVTALKREETVQRRFFRDERHDDTDGRQHQDQSFAPSRTLYRMKPGEPL